VRQEQLLAAVFIQLMNLNSLDAEVLASIRNRILAVLTAAGPKVRNKQDLSTSLPLLSPQCIAALRTSVAL
jgi:hypothetical protein